MRIFDLARKDIWQIVRDWKAALFLLVMPVLFTLFFGVVLGAAFAPAEADPRLPVGVVDGDGTPLSAGFLRLLEGSQAVRPVPLDDAADASRRVDEGDLAAAVLIPAGYAERLLADETAPLEVFAVETEPVGRSAVTAVESVVSRLLGAVEAAHISVETMGSVDRAAFADEADRRAHLEAALDEALAAWESGGALEVTVQPGGGSSTQEEDVAAGPSGFVQSSAGMMVQFAVFGLVTSAMVLVLERKARTLQRLLTTPIRRAEVIAGHAAAMFSIVLAQQIILVLLGQFAFGVDYLREPLAILLMVLVLAFWAASLGLLISTLARTEEQVVTLSLMAMFLFAAMGGAWFPLEVAGATFAAIGHVLPSAWAMDGLQNITLRGLGFQSVLLPAGVVALYGAAFLALALWRFRFE